MPALGGRIKVEFDEFDKNSHAYILFQHHPINLKMSHLSQKTTMVSTFDMPRYCLIPFDIF